MNKVDCFTCKNRWSRLLTHREKHDFKRLNPTATRVPTLMCRCMVTQEEIKITDVLECDHYIYDPIYTDMKVVNIKRKKKGVKYRAQRNQST